MKFLTTCLFSILFCFTGFSQGFHFGIGAGANFTNLVNLPLDYHSYAFGYQINGLAEYKFSEKLGLRLEPGLESRRVGAKNDPKSEKSKFNYITMPVMLTYSPFSKFTIMAGPELAYILSSPFKISKKAHEITGIEIQEFDFGFKAGVSYNISEHFELAFKYYRGIRDSAELDFYNLNAESIGIYKIYYQGFSLGAFYRMLCKHNINKKAWNFIKVRSSKLKAHS